MGKAADVYVVHQICGLVLYESLYVRTMHAVLVQEARTYVFNLRRTCAARVTVVVLCVCLSVYDYFRTTGYEAAYERYQQSQCYKGNVAILLKLLRSRDMA